VKVEKVFKGGKKKLLLKRIKMKTCCTVFQSPSQKAAGKGHMRWRSAVLIKNK